MSVTSGLPISVQILSGFCQVPDLYAKIPAFYANIFLFVLHCEGNIRVLISKDYVRYVANDNARDARMRGVGGVMLVEIVLLKCAHGIILARNLLHQPKVRFLVPFWLPVPHGTGELISADQSWVWPSDFNYDQTVNPATKVRNGFIHFCCHESTKISEYDQGLPL